MGGGYLTALWNLLGMGGGSGGDPAPVWEGPVLLAGRYDWTTDAGTTVYRVYSLQDADGNPINLTGYRARLQVRSTFLPTGTVYATLGTSSPDAGLTIPTPSDGRIIVGPVDKEDFADLIPAGDRQVWDLFIYVNGGAEYRVLFGVFYNRSIATLIA